MRRATAFFLTLLLFAGCGADTEQITGVSTDTDLQSQAVTVAAAPSLAVSAVQQRVFHSHLDGADAGVETRAQGQAIFRLSADESELYFKVVVANIKDVVGAHIHLAAPGSNGPIVLPLLGNPFIDDPGITTNGILVEGTATSADVAGSLEGGLEALLAAMSEGNTYVNVHTVENRGGQIRGQIR